MTLSAAALWLGIFPVILLGSALVVTGALKGLRDGRAGGPFFTVRPYSTWAVSGSVTMAVGFVAMVVWLVALPA